MHRKRIGKGYSLVITLMIILSPLTSMYLWDGLKSAAAESPLNPITTITGLDNDDNFGWNVSWIGDVNGDGFDDIIVGAPYTDRYGGIGNWWDTNWSYRKKLTFNNSGQLENLLNFPVLVKLNSSNFDYLKAKSNGSDLRFIDDDSFTELNYEIESWNSSGNSFIWVNVTNITGASSTDFIWMYYGNIGAINGENPSEAWDSNYVMVQHLEENATGTRFDSTKYGSDGLPVNYDGDEAVPGMIGGADDFDGLNDFLNFGNPVELQITGAITLEVWFKADFVDNDFLLAKMGENGEMGWDLSFEDWPPIAPDGYAEFRYSTNGSNLNSVGWERINASEWYYIVGEFNPSTCERFFLNGIMTYENTISVPPALFDPPVNIYLAHAVRSSAIYFDGIIDEVRISNIARSMDWISAQYLSMNNTYITYGVEEIRAWWNTQWSYRKKLIFDNSGQSEDLKNFPVLVNLNSSNFDYSNAKSDGTDLRFIDADGSTQLKYHIEDWNSSGYSYIWVNITSIDRASSTDHIWMYYGNPAASDIQDVSGTYDTNFLAVWHLNETGTGTRYDSTSNDYDGTPENYDGDEATIGKIDGADNFNQNNDIINVSTMNPQSYNDFTIEAWYQSNMDTGTDDGYMFDHGIDESVNPEIEMGFSDDAGHEDKLVLKILDNGANSNRYYGTSDIVDQQLHYLVAVRDNGRIKLYVDGLIENNETDDDAGETISIDTAMGPYIGDFVSTSEFINGILDEVRVSDKARSSDWVKVQYLSMNNSFITYASEESLSENCGAAYIFFGYPGITLNNLNTTNANVTIYGSNAGDLFGWSLADAGDVNNDGYDDIIIGAPGWGVDRGRAYIFHGRTTLSWSATYDPDTDADVILTGESDGDKFGFSVSCAGNVNNQDYLDGWLYRKKITINASKVTGDLIDFPMLISIMDTDLKNKARIDGYDIIFVESDGKTKLDHEIESYNSSSGELVAWVRIPLISSVTDTVIYMYYSNSNASDQQNIEGVWRDNYRGVWHLAETSGLALDSTSYGLDGTLTGTITRGVAGPIGNAYQFDGTDGIVNMGNPADRHLDFGTGNFTVSVWVNVTQYVDYQYFVYKGGGSDSNDGYTVYYRPTGELASVSVSDGIPPRVQDDFDPIENESAYLVLVADRSTNELYAYLNGVLKPDINSINSEGDINDSSDLRFSRAGSEVNGIMDEVRISSVARSAAWIQAEYNNTNDTSTFYTLGNKESNINYDDVIVGAYGHAGESGRAYVFFGCSGLTGEISAGNADVIINGTTPNDHLGWDVSRIEDVNNDGYEDIIIGAPGYNSNTGAAYIFFGDNFLPSFIDDIDANVTITGGATSDEFGFSLSAAYDLNEDGYDDVMVGAPGNNSDIGAVYIFFGSDSLNNLINVIDANVTMQGESTGDKFGHSLDNAGDLNGDGALDVIVGAPFYDDGVETDAGAIYVFEGGVSMDNTADWSYKGEYANDHLGYSVSFAGNVNGDGLTYLIAGAPNNDDGGVNAGKVYLLTIMPTKPVITNVLATPSIQNIDGYVNISCDVVAVSGVDSVWVNITLPGGGFTNVSLTQDIGNQWYYYNNYTIPGIYQYVIWANDTLGNWTQSGIYFFEVINSLPSLSSPQVNPTVGYTDTGFNFTVIYTDMDNHPPNNITVNITGIGFYDLNEIDPLDTDYTDGKAYYYNISGFGVGSYSFHFAANDTIGDWTESGILSFDVIESGPTILLEQVTPTTGNTDTRFNFTVTYIYPDNQPPSNITVNITGLGIYNLIEVDPLDTDYSDGKDYYYNASGFGVGQYSFHFAANDTNGNWNESSTLMFEVLNREPILSLEQVIPTTGYIDTWYNFTVTYSDLDNHTPYNVTVNITGVGIYDLIEFDTLDTNFSDGKEYYYNMSGFVLGSYSFHFAANDTFGNWTKSGTLQFDVINRGPMLSLEQVDPATGYLDTWFNFTVTYTDLDNHAPDLISVNITGIGIYYLVEVDILDTDYIDGKEYYYDFSGLAIGSYNFHFAANDTFGNWIETGILQFDVVNRVPILISGQVNPSVGDMDTTFNFTVTYTDLDNNAPDMITVNITGIGVYDLIELDPSDTTYMDGKAYYYNASGFAIGSYAFHFAANDTFGNWTETGILQFDVINRGPFLSLEQVDPITGYIDTWFNFTVVYTDLDNHALDIITVNITGLGVYDLIEVDPLDTDYSDGKEYYYNASGFALGQYFFHFSANDTFGNWTETGALQFDVINRDPVLTSGQVNPSVGDIDTAFNFTVTYTDLDNHAPDIITVNITGIGIFDLFAQDPLDMDYTDGKVYYYNSSGFTIGSYSFHFAANDTKGDWIETIILNFDLIDRVPTLLFEQVDPTTGYTDTWFNYSVTYVDLDNHAPDIITLNITGVGVYSLFALDPLDMDYTDGKVYYYNLSGFAVGSYSFHFAANDTFGNWIETWSLPFEVINRAPILSFGQVDPTIGYTDTWFNFTVNYTDFDNHAPLNITLNLSGPSGGIFDLLEVDPTDYDYKDGKEYYFNTTLTSGLYSFHFAANDSLVLWAIETTEIDAPDVVPKHGALGVVDCVEEFSDEIHLNATLFDDFNVPIPNENVAFYIDINKNRTYEVGEFAGIDSTVANGSVSVIYTSNLPVGTYYFIAVYVGSGEFVVDNGEALLTIVAKAARLTATSDVVNEGEDIYLTAILIDNESDPIGNEQVAIYIDKNKNGFYEGGEFIGLTTTSPSGAASVSYTVNLAPESYGILARYIGTSNYAVYEIEGLLIVQNVGNNPPMITGIVPNQIKPEDSLPWALDLTFYEEDVEDSGPYLNWYLTGVNTSLYSVTGMNSSDDVFTFIPVPDAFGNDEVILWLEDSSGAKVSQVLWVNITPVNDPPYFAPSPPNLYVHYDDPSTDEDDPSPWDYTFYVHDIETPVEDLIITTSESTVNTEYGYAEVDGLKVTFHYPQTMVGQNVLVFLTLSDGTDTAQAMIIVNITSDWVPELVYKLPDVVLEENSTIYNVFDLDDYFIDRDEDSLFFSSGYHNIRVDINENNTVDITALGHWTGSELVTFRAEDPIGAIAEDVITVTVIPVNDPPEISGVPDLVVHYDYSYAFDLSPYISDPDNLTSELIVWTSELWDYIWLQQNNKLGIVVNYPESMNGTTIPVTIYVSDGIEIASQQIQISVTNNFPPELTQNLPDIFFDEDTILWNAFCLSDYFDDIDSNVLYYTNGTKFINATINENLTVDFSAPENWYGFEWVTFRATDPTGALAEDKILVVVVPVNDAPTIASIPRQEKEEGDQWILDLSQYIDDVDNNASELIITVRSEVGQDYVVLVGNILIFQYPEGVRNDVISITVSDGELEASRSFIVDIKGSEQVVPTIWDLIPWPWVIFFLISGIGGAFAYYKKKSKYWVYEAFLIHEKGVPMAHVSQEERSDLEDVVVGGMFTAVQDFINDAFSGKTADEDWELDEMKFGDNKILIERSQKLFLAVIFEGNGGKLRNLVKKLLVDINKEYGAVLEDWDGDMTKLSGIRPMVAGLISKKARKKPGSERLDAQSQLSAQEEDFDDAMMRWEDPTKMAGKELEEYIERVKGAVPEIVKAQEVEIQEMDVSECPVCGKKIEARINKCPRCGVQFTTIEDLLILSSKKLEDGGGKNIQKEGGNHEN